MQDDFNASANISAGHNDTGDKPAFFPDETRPIRNALSFLEEVRKVKPAPSIEPEHIRRLRSISISLETIQDQVTLMREMVDLMLEEDVCAKLSALGFNEKDAHWWVHKSNQVAVMLPNNPLVKPEHRSPLYDISINNSSDPAEAENWINIGTYRNLTREEMLTAIEVLTFEMP